MPKRVENYCRVWTQREVDELKALAEARLPAQVIGLRLGRTPAAIQTKANLENIKLRSIHEFPYYR